MWGLPDEQRIVQTEWYEGNQVRIAYSAFRSTSSLETVEGELVGVAVPLTGAPGGTRLAIVRCRRSHRLITLSLATIYTIEEVRQWSDTA